MNKSLVKFPSVGDSRQYVSYYAITISPPYRGVKPSFLYEDDKHDIRRWFNKFSKYYILYPEFSKLESRLHYHGVIVINDWMKFHKSRVTFSRRVGFVQIKPLKTFRDHVTWITYCQKEMASQYLEPIMYMNLRRHRVPLVRTPELDQGIMVYLNRVPSPPPDNGSNPMSIM